MKFIFMLVFFILFLEAKEHKDNHKHYYTKDLTYLNLNETQKESIKDIIKKYRKQIKQYRDEKDILEEEKRTSFLTDKFDENKIIEINKKISFKNTQIEVEFLKQIYQVLDTSQRKKFAIYVEEWEVE